jgi:hypothetical protein
VHQRAFRNLRSPHVQFVAVRIGATHDRRAEFGHSYYRRPYSGPPF